MSCQLPDCVTKSTELDNLRAAQQGLNDQITQLTQERDQLIQEKDRLNGDLNNLSAEKQGLNNQITQLTQEKEQLKAQTDIQIGNLHQRIDTLNSENAKVNEEKAEVIAENKLLNDEKQFLEQKLNETLDQLEKLKKPEPVILAHPTYLETRTPANEFNKYYDCSIITGKLISLLAGLSWSIDLKEGYLNKFKIRSALNSLKIGVIGFENVGKSYLVGKILDEEVPQGKRTKTKGLSLIYSNKFDNCTIIDTIGANASTNHKAIRAELEDYFAKHNLTKDEIDEMLEQDDILVEDLIQEFLIKNTEVLLIVVGKIEREERNFIQRIKDKGGKRIIIIHNLYDTQTIEEANEIINDKIINTFNTRTQSFCKKPKDKQNQYVYRENADDDIEHLPIAQENTEAGNYFNKPAINYLRSVISTTAHTPELDLVQAFSDHLNTHFSRYLNVKEPKVERTKQNKEDEEKESPDEILLNESMEDFRSIGKNEEYEEYLEHRAFKEPVNIVKTEGDCPQELKLSHFKRFTLNMGKLSQRRCSTKKGYIDVPYSVKIVTKEKEKLLQLEFEVAGFFKEEELEFGVESKNNQIFVKIRGESKNNVTRNAQDEKLCENTRRFGMFEIEIEPIQLKNYSISPFQEPKFIKEEGVNGLKILTFKLEEVKSRLRF